MSIEGAAIDLDSRVEPENDELGLIGNRSTPPLSRPFLRQVEPDALEMAEQFVQPGHVFRR